MKLGTNRFVFFFQWKGFVDTEMTLCTLLFEGSKEVSCFAAHDVTALVFGNHKFCKIGPKFLPVMHFLQSLYKNREFCEFDSMSNISYIILITLLQNLHQFVWNSFRIKFFIDRISKKKSISLFNILFILRVFVSSLFLFVFLNCIFRFRM